MKEKNRNMIVVTELQFPLWSFFGIFFLSALKLPFNPLCFFTPFLPSRRLAVASKRRESWPADVKSIVVWEIIGALT